MSILTGTSDILIQAFSRMLIHSVWQGALLAVIAGAVLLITKKTGAAVRYNLVLVLFFMFLFVTGITFIYEYNDSLRTVIKKESVLSSYQFVQVNNNQTHLPSSFNTTSLLQIINNYFSQHYLLIVILWFTFFMAKSVSMAGNIMYMHRAKHHRVFEPSDLWKEKVTSLCEKLQLKKAVLLLESGYLKVPAVIGYFKPVILIPVGLIARIPAEQVEAVLLHELAHIKRSDYAVNFIQSIADAVFFFNPGLLWVSSLLREERENCCDDIAIAQTNNKEEFVQALISFKDYSLSTPKYTVAFSGQKSTLLNRVMRIVYQENKTISIKENGIFIVGIAMLSLMAFTIYPVKNANLIKQVLSNSITHNIRQLPIVAGSFEIPVHDKLDVNTALVVKKEEPENLINIDSATDKQLADTTKSAPNNIIGVNRTTTAYPMQDLIANAKFNDDKFYSRVSLGDGNTDMIQVLLNAGHSMMKVTVNHNAKVAIIINGVLHEESEVAGFTLSQIDSYPGKLNSVSGSSIAYAQKLYPDVDLSKYDAAIVVGGDQNLATDSKQVVQNLYSDRSKYGGGSGRVDGYFTDKPKANSP